MVNGVPGGKMANAEVLEMGIISNLGVNMLNRLIKMLMLLLLMLLLILLQ